MRRVAVYNFSKKPPQLLGTVTLTPRGSVLVEGFRGPMLAQMKQGIPKPPQMKTMVTVADGDKFLDAVLFEYKGSYVRAVEESVAERA